MTDVAIVGMGCLFPGAPDVATYWRNIVGGVDAVGDPPPEWGADACLEPGSSANDRIYTARGGYLGPLATFDPLRYGVMPSSVEGGEPDQFLALRVAHDALADSGYLERPFDRERAEVIVGRGTYINRAFVNVVQHGVALEQALALLRRVHPEHTEAELAELKAELKASLPPFTPDMAPGLVPNVMTGRIANRLDLRGPNETIDAACASSLIAVDRAMQDLRADRCELALVGGVHCSTPPPILMIFCQLEALSRTGRIRPFARGADGTLLGEGAGFVVLRRRADAERDGDRVYAVLKAVGSSSDGRALGLLAPRVEGEELALRRAYDAAGLDPRSVGLIEAHGTGTPVGDATEIAALGRVLGGGEPSIALGCVKSMIAHLIPASGMAGLIKTALALHHRTLPPTLHAEDPDPELGLDATPLYLNTRTRPWIHGGPAPRRAGVDAFGFGGINAHALLEEAGGEAARDPVAPGAELLLIRGATRADVRERGSVVLRALSTAGLDEVAAALAREEGGQCLAIVAASAAEARERLGSALARLAEPARTRLHDPGGAYWSAEPLGPVAFLFPGEGSQYEGMLADLCLRHPEARRWFDLIDRVFWGHRGGPLPSRFVFPPPGAAPSDALYTMDGAGEALFAASQALLAVLERLGVRADAVAGHSSGEYSALLAAGALELDGEEELIASTRALNDAYRELAAGGRIPRAALVAVAGGPPAVLERLLARDDLHLAVDNCPHQVVLCGSEEAVAAARGELAREGAVCTAVPFDRPYHTPLFAEFASAVRDSFAGLRFWAPRTPLYSCVTAAPFPDDPEAVRADVAGQWARRVRFRETVERMHADGIRIFVEVGPSGTLTSFVGDTLRGRPHLAVATDLPHRAGTTQLAHALGQLAAAGVAFDAPALFARREIRAVDVDAPTAPPEDRAPPLATTLPRPAIERLRPRPAALPASIVAPRHAALAEYAQTMERFLEVHGAVMAAAAGPAPEPAPRPLLGDDVTIAAGRLEARVVLDVEHHRYLRDHTLGGRVSDLDRDLLALPVVPLTMTMELMAEAAAVLRPGHRLTALREVRAHRWIALDDGAVTLRVTASGDDEIAVTVREADDDARATPIAECTAVLAPGAHEVPAGTMGAASEGDELYGEVMFHGPAFRAVRSLGTLTADAGKATLEALPRAGLLAGNPDPRFVLDPVLLDAAGQLIGFWAADRFAHGFHVFPYRLAELTVHAAPPAPGTRVLCRASIETLGEQRLRSDIELAGDDGSVLYRLRSWEDRRFDLPDALHRRRVDPGAGALSRPLTTDGGLVGVVLDGLPEALLEDHGGVWMRVLAHLVLSRAERADWRALAPRRRREWLLGRAAAKDAVRALRHERGELVPRPADIEVRGEPRPVVRDGSALVSIAHAGGAAAAVAADPGTLAGVGIDIEPRRTLPGAVIESAFAPDELRRLGDDALRGWCAKEAAGKALGIGLDLDPRRLRIEAVEDDVVRVRHAGAIRDAIEVRTGEDGGFVVAVAAQPRADALATLGSAPAAAEA